MLAHRQADVRELNDGARVLMLRADGSAPRRSPSASARFGSATASSAAATTRGLAFATATAAQWSSSTPRGGALTVQADACVVYCGSPAG